MAPRLIPRPTPARPPRPGAFDRAVDAAVDARAHLLAVRQPSAQSSDARIMAAAVVYHDARTTVCDLRVAAALSSGGRRSIDRNGFPIRAHVR